MLAVVVVRRLFWANAINFTCFVNLQAKEAPLLQKNTKRSVVKNLNKSSPEPVLALKSYFRICVL